MTIAKGIYLSNPSNGLSSDPLLQVKLKEPTKPHQTPPNPKHLKAFLWTLGPESNSPPMPRPNPPDRTPDPDQADPEAPGLWVHMAKGMKLVWGPPPLAALAGAQVLRLYDNLVATSAPLLKA